MILQFATLMFYIFLINEALSGQQKLFALVAMGVLFPSAAAVRLGLIGEAFGKWTFLISVVIVLWMLAVRLQHFLQTRNDNRSVGD